VFLNKNKAAAFFAAAAIFCGKETKICLLKMH